MQDNKNIATTDPVNACNISVTEVTNAIKPKAIRLKAVAYHSTDLAFLYDSTIQAASLTLDKESIETSKGNLETIILHRPVAHLVSSSTILPNLAHENPQQTLANAHSHAIELKEMNCDQSSLNLHRSLMNSTTKLQYPSSYANCSKKAKDRKPSDGYIWRKYGQKLPKGREFPRGYYRCTHPACPVKKMVDRSEDGEITEIIYRGDHSHPKPSSSRLKDKVSVNGGNLFEIETENGSHLDISPVSVSFSTDLGVKTAEFVAMDDYLTTSQKRKNVDNLRDSAAVAASSSVPKSMASIAYNNANNDGYSWRKYGHKAVKGKNYPRNYYRCSHQKCCARKYVDRASEDSGIFVTTYKGEHNHE